MKLGIKLLFNPNKFSFVQNNVQIPQETKSDANRTTQLSARLNNFLLHRCRKQILAKKQTISRD